MKTSAPWRQAPTFQSATAPSPPWPAPPAPDGLPRARAFDQFIVKLHSRCNLSCDYCYVYALRDTGWRDRPRTMSARTVDRLAERIAEHARRHRLPAVRVIVHGGEPLLGGAGPVTRLVETVRDRLRGTGATARFTVQSNGVLLDAPLLAELARHDIRVGLSLDGDRAGHDRHRRHRDGRGSHAEVERALELLRRPEHRPLFEGLLCTVDLANDPERCYDALAAHRPPMIDFLLPHATWDHPPAGAAAGDAPYGRWLAVAFDRWWAAGRPLRVRLFDSVVDLCRGGTGHSETVGTAPAAAVVIETDGSIEWTDSLKAVANGAAATGLDIHRHSLDAAFALEETVAALDDGLCRTCRACPVSGICGGGLRAHRFGRGQGFDNPSVYCRDLGLLITHIRNTLRHLAD
ncbi:FxsB family radical SAM/SPASM domain protein [Streptomyces sp. LX-29]|uniref:FxsB family cyclophane-forming radical SAM/SPASM peptide maturase n=1 Tax=Streptomyces sp. LX-29 TaxID=2900152 RepID=UPI00240D7DAC|nr:FxsB family cyclophane-forming radical SAM/SPASM peptide maturase [Streptomyces sp. LX-29]WFB08484.1 FxsB family radical SAM/SPASM domain protein [Streptomyces sp. LX-29]